MTEEPTPVKLPICRACRAGFVPDPNYPLALICCYCWRQAEIKTDVSKCRSCGASVRWLKVNMSPTVDKPRAAHIFSLKTRCSHFADCPQADDWRRAKEQMTLEEGEDEPG